MAEQNSNVDPSIIEQAVKIRAINNKQGTQAEYGYIEGNYGKDFKIVKKILYVHNDNDYEIFYFRDCNGNLNTVAFDISSFYCNKKDEDK